MLKRFEGASKWALLLPALAGLNLVACGDDEGNDDPIVDMGTPDMGTPDMGPDVVDIVATAQAAGLNALVSAATQAGLDSTLASGGPFTVFAPTDAAFAALGDAAPSDPALLANVLLHHVAAGTLDSSEVLAQTGGIESLAGTTLAVDGSASPPTVGGAPLSSSLDVEATNGIVHVIDAVMVPPSIPEAVAASDDLSVLETAVGAASEGIREALASGPITVFAPVDAAFEGIDLGSLTQEQIDAILSYHVVEGQLLAGELSDGQTLTTVNGATLTVNIGGEGVTLTDAAGASIAVESTDLRLLNGVVHTIGGVLQPSIPPESIVDVAQAAGLTSLLTAATTAGLADTLATGGPFTVFAPTNAAFDALGAAAPTDPGLLANVLLHHVVPGEQGSADVLAADGFDTAAKTRIAVDDAASPPTIGGAQLDLENLDVEASNGVVHLLDQVMIPPTILEAAVTTEDLSTLATAASAADPAVTQTLSGPGPITVFAPVNSAFNDVDVPALVADPDRLTDILTYHVTTGQVLSTDLSDGQEVTMANGVTLTVNVTPEGVTLTDGLGQEIPVVETDIRLLNGTVHLIGGVLNPGNIVEQAQAAGLTTLLGAVERVGLTGVIRSTDPLTVFAPTNEAFSNIGANLGNVSDAVLSNILVHHVVADRLDSTAVLAAGSLPALSNLALAVESNPLRIGGAALSTTLDVIASNGIVHVMDEVIVPPTSVEVAQAVPDLSTLVDALGRASSLVQAAASPNTLEGADPITVFAPLDSAFSGIDLNMLSQAQIDGILAYHVVPGQVLSGDLPVGPTTVTTAAGIDLTVTRAANGDITITDASGGTANVDVSLRDIRTLTGAVHVIDAVLDPGT